MGVLNACEYAAVNSRVHCAKSRFLGASDWQGLMNAGSLAGAVQLLSGTAYGEGLSALGNAEGGTPGLVSLRATEHSLNQCFVSRFASHLRFLHGAPARCLKVLLGVYDLLNLKKLMRQECMGGDKDFLSLELYDLGKASLLPRKKWAALAAGEKIGRSLEKTCYGEAYRSGMAAFAGERNIMQLELQIEKSYFSELHECLAECCGIGSGGLEIFGLLTDEVCLQYAVRMRYSHGLEPSAILPLLPLKWAAHWNTDLFWRVSVGASEEEFLAALKAEKWWSGLKMESLAGTVRELRLLRARLCRNVLRSSSPLSFSPLAACFFLGRQELRDLTAVLQSKRFGRELGCSAPVMLACCGAGEGGR